MKITDIRWTSAFIPIEAPLRYSVGSHPGFTRIVIEVETDEGITGLGECYGGASRAGQLAELKPLLIGEDPMNLERIRWKVAAPVPKSFLVSCWGLPELNLPSWIFKERL